ncbi:MAG: O-antigen ligase family protein [Polyangiaceae bacterium]|nr:O-antigen ligase family protein [Polyangiaceae bacterium]
MSASVRAASPVGILLGRGAWAVYLLIVGVLAFRFGSIRIAGQVVGLSDLAFLVAATLFGGASLLRGVKVRSLSVYWPMLAYAAAMGLSILVSAEPKRSLIKFAGEIYLLALAFLGMNLITTEARLRSVVRVWLSVTGLSVVACALGVAIFYLGVRERAVNLVLWNYGSLPPGNYPRLYGFFTNGNMFCNYLIVSVLITLAALYRRFISRLAAACLLLLTAAAAAFTFSTGIGGIALGAGLWLWLETRGTSNARLGRLALGTGALLATALFAATTVSLSGSFAPSVRILVWKDALRTFLQHPVLGKGVGTDPVNVSWVVPSGIQENLTEAHNVVLSVAAQEGIVGLSAFGWLMVHLLRSWRLRSWNTGEAGVWPRALGCALVGSLGYQGLSGAFEDARHIWVLIGLLVAALHFPTSKGTVPSSSPAGSLPTAASESH